MSAVRTIVAKEWADVARHKTVLGVIVFLPLLLTAIPLASAIPIPSPASDGITPAWSPSRNSPASPHRARQP